MNHLGRHTLNSCAALLAPALVLLVAVALGGCRDRATGEGASLPPGFVLVPAGAYSFGSTDAEREKALGYSRPADEAALRARMALEHAPFEAKCGAFIAGIYPVNNMEYAEFITATGHRAPSMTVDEWNAACKSSGLGLEGLDNFNRYVQPVNWRDGKLPPGRELMPVVLVDHADCMAYCKWLSGKLGRKARLPDELESQLAGGQTLWPWGDEWRSNACQASPSAIGPALQGTVNLRDALGKADWADVSPLGVRDYAGQVYEWTSTPDGSRRGARFACGGGSWLDEPGDCRRSCRRSLPESTRHVLLGFRVALEP